MYAIRSYYAFVFSSYMAMTGETGEDLDIALWPFMVFIGICGVVFVGRLLANPTVELRSAETGGRSWI